MVPCRHLTLPVTVSSSRLNTSSLLCDCHLKWLPVWVTQQTFLLRLDASCAHPQTLQGRSVFGVGQEELVCGE